MANFIVTYDLNGPRPSHHEMDKHLEALGAGFQRARALETVWYVAGPTNAAALRGYVQRILSQNDLLLVVEASNAAWTKLLVDGAAFKAAFEAQPASMAA
jgi:hypothetical protein